MYTASWFLGQLTWRQLGLAVVLTWPYALHMSGLAVETRKWCAERLAEQQALQRRPLRGGAAAQLAMARRRSRSRDASSPAADEMPSGGTDLTDDG